ncbi:MAG: hypothetical protein JJE52_18180 [Acidimicrobiia bacterium]|nr:hypothetical protein [Acidimicrobiia bacterium]
MTDSPGPVVRPLDDRDHAALATFRCRGFRQPWTDVVESMVQNDLAEAVGRGVVQADVLWVGAELCGVAAWTLLPENVS